MRINKNQILVLRTLLCVLLILPALSVSAANNCFECHERSTFKGEVVHQPVARGECASCHVPHVSRYPALLRNASVELCRDCHTTFMKALEERKFQHKPVKKGECGACHTPHVSDFPNLLKEKPGSECYQCHKKPEKAYAFTHQPFAKNQCYRCHDPHAADDSRLLRRAETELCLSCHKAGATLKKAHLGRNLKKMGCLSCHNPHGGDNRELLRPVRHEPFKKGKCKTCHEQKKTGVQMCLQCHQSVMKTFLQPHTHLRLAAGEKNFCLLCHDPHASEEAALPAVDRLATCASCHSDKFKRRQEMLYHHPGPWDCGDCHQIHGADNPAMLQGHPMDLCAKCHKRHKQFTHPIGDKALDPRNQESMSCITCHDPCTGTMFKQNLRGSAERGLCVQCHPKH